MAPKWLLNGSQTAPNMPFGAQLGCEECPLSPSQLESGQTPHDSSVQMGQWAHKSGSQMGTRGRAHHHMLLNSGIKGPVSPPAPNTRAKPQDQCGHNSSYRTRANQGSKRNFSGVSGTNVQIGATTQPTSKRACRHTASVAAKRPCTVPFNAIAHKMPKLAAKFHIPITTNNSCAEQATGCESGPQCNRGAGTGSGGLVKAGKQGGTPVNTQLQ